MANPAIKPIKVLSDIKLKQEAETKKGLTVSGSIKDSCDVGLHVENHVFFDKDLYVADKTYAVGFSQVGVLDVNGLLQVSGHLVATGSFELSGSSNFLTINNKAPRNVEGMYFVDNAIHGLDEKIYLFTTQFNENKRRFDSNPTINGTQEHTSDFPWNVAGYISLDIMVYNPADESWSNDLISVKMIKNTANDTIKFIVTTPILGEPGVNPNTIIRVIATRQTDIL